MRKTKEQKGITLIALIITIVVLLILAAVAINAITEYNIIENANSAAQKYGNQAGIEDETLGGYSSEIDKYLGGTTGGNGSGEGSGTGTTKTVAEVKNVPQTSNTKVVDEFGNQIVVPAGFKIRVDEGTERTKGSATSFATHVTEGIVIEDASGNQFVWVPVGKIYTTTDEATKEATAKTITLGRYSNFTATDGVYTPAQTAENYATPTTIDSYYTEETATDTGLGQYGNAIARNIGDFVASATQNKGYYIGRFEAGKENDKLVCKAGQAVYASITQPNASTACKNMYNEGVDGYNANTFSSDLINSYAWDTAIIFIQTFGGESNYYEENKCTSFTTTGGNQDEYCNINDMSGNAEEWSTETSDYYEDVDDLYFPCVTRGGEYYAYEGRAFYYTSHRSYDGGLTTSTGTSTRSFRPLLYVAL